MKHAKGRDASVVHSRSVDFGLGDQAREDVPISFGFREGHYTGRFEPRADLLQRFRGCRGRGEDPFVRNDGEEFMQTGPRQCPGGGAFGQVTHACGGGLVPLAVTTVSVNEDVGVDRDQPPRPS